MDITKKCTLCNRELLTDKFSKRSLSRDGLRSSCKDCVKEYNKKNEKRIKEYQLKWREKNIGSTQRVNKTDEEKKQKKKEWYVENKEVILEKARSKRFAKKQLSKERECFTEDELKIRKRISGVLCLSKKRTKNENNDGTLSIDSLIDLKNKQDHKCFYCSLFLDFSIPRFVQLDHIRPTSKGGWHSIDNVVWCCYKCNIQKRNKTNRIGYIINKKRGSK